MSACAYSDFGCSDCSLECLLVRVSVLEGYVHHRTQRSSPVCRKRAGIEADLADKVGIEDADRATGSALSREMVDVGNLDPIYEEGIFRRTSSPDDQVVTIADR